MVFIFTANFGGAAAGANGAAPNPIIVSSFRAISIGIFLFSLLALVSNAFFHSMQNAISSPDHQIWHSNGGSEDTYGSSRHYGMTSMDYHVPRIHSIRDFQGYFGVKDGEEHEHANTDTTPPITQIHAYNRTMASQYHIRRAWSHDASRLRSHKGNKCVSKIRRDAMGNGDAESDTSSVQQVYIICFNFGNDKDAEHMELSIPAFHGMEFIEDVAFLDDALETQAEHQLREASGEDSASPYFCVYLLVRNDARVYRGYCIDRKHLGNHMRFFGADAAMIDTEWNSPRGTPMHQLLRDSTQQDDDSSKQWIHVKGPRRYRPPFTAPYFLSNPITFMTYRNGTQANVLILSQHIQKDVLRSRVHDSDSSDIDVTSYILVDPSTPPLSKDKPNRESLGFVGVPPFVQYFLSGHLRDEVYRLQPLLASCTPHQTTCIFSFLSGLYLSIDLPVVRNTTTMQKSVDFTISVVDYRHHTPDLNLESIFGRRLIFQRDWLPPLVRISNDASRVALADIQHRRVLVFRKRHVEHEEPYEAYAELYEFTETQRNGRFHVGHEEDYLRPRDLILDVQFIEVMNTSSDSHPQTMVQVLYSGIGGKRYSRFYPLQVESTSIIAWLYADFMDFFRGKWKLLMTIFALTAGFIINEMVIWKRFQDQRARRQQEQASAAEQHSATGDSTFARER